VSGNAVDGRCANNVAGIVMAIINNTGRKCLALIGVTSTESWDANALCSAGGVPTLSRCQVIEPASTEPTISKPFLPECGQMPMLECLRLNAFESTEPLWRAARM
jgi:hypothetical protein